ncbi:MAG: hypothetical protein ABSB09_11235 [Acidimicrobiales bacterium]|jgi:hypothetical protein
MDDSTPGGFTTPDYGPPSAADDAVPAPGSLKLVGRRSWKTWQLVIAVLAAALFGMWFNGNTGSTTSAATGPVYKLPAASTGASTTTTTLASGSTTTTTTASGSTTTTTAPGSTTTTLPGGATTTTVPVVLPPASVLVPATQLTGNWTSPSFTIDGGTWNIGWAFACSPVPATTPTFAVFVVPTGGSPGATPAVTSSVASGQSVTPQTSPGSQQIEVQAPAGCRWVVKVTGSGT